MAPDKTAEDDEFAHGPLGAERIPARDVAPEFLAGLEARSEVLAVAEGWNNGHAALPPGVTWVMYPNGDLERVGFM
jgi:hypothetical protein